MNEQTKFSQKSFLGLNLNKNPIELRSALIIVSILLFWFNWKGAYFSSQFAKLIDFVFKTSFSNSGMFINISVFSIAAIGIILTLRFDKKWVWKFKLNNKALYSLLIGFIAIQWISIGTSYLISLFNAPTVSTNQESLNKLAAASPVFLFVLTVLLAPFVEEMLYRLALIRTFGNRKYSVIVGVLFSSLYFGFGHIESAISSGNWIELIWLLYYGGAGLVFSLVYVLNNQIFVSILLHFFLNLFAFF